MKASSEPVTGDGVADRKREEAEPYGQHDEVQHFDAPGASAVQLGVVRCGTRPRAHPHVAAKSRMRKVTVPTLPLRLRSVCCGIAPKTCHLRHRFSMGAEDQRYRNLI